MSEWAALVFTRTCRVGESAGGREGISELANRGGKRHRRDPRNQSIEQLFSESGQRRNGRMKKAPSTQAQQRRAVAAT